MNWLVLPPTESFTDTDYVAVSNNGNIYKIRIDHFRDMLAVGAGTKGDKGDKGDEPSDDRLQELISQFLPSTVPGPKGDDGTGWTHVDADPDAAELEQPSGTFAFNETTGQVWRAIDADGNWEQVFNLTGPEGPIGPQSMLAYTGNPNGVLSGLADQMAIDPTNGNLYQCEGGTGWTNIGNLKGPTGDAGAGSGDMLASVYDPRNFGNISGHNDGGMGGYLLLDGGSGANAHGSELQLGGGFGTNCRASNVTLTGGYADNARGGDLDMSGGSLPGGNITTKNGGGSLDTTGTGYLELGEDGVRARIENLGAVEGGNFTVTLPDKAGRLAIIPNTPQVLTSLSNVIIEMTREGYQYLEIGSDIEFENAGSVDDGRVHEVTVVLKNVSGLDANLTFSTAGPLFCFVGAPPPFVLPDGKVAVLSLTHVNGSSGVLIAAYASQS